MGSARLATAAAGVALSVVVSVVAWLYFDIPFLFFFVPFVPFLFRRGEQPPAKECPACGFRTREGDHEYCPRDGHRLE